MISDAEIYGIPKGEYSSLLGLHGISPLNLPHSVSMQQHGSFHVGIRSDLFPSLLLRDAHTSVPSYRLSCCIYFPASYDHMAIAAQTLNHNFYPLSTHFFLSFLEISRSPCLMHTSNPFSFFFLFQSGFLPPGFMRSPQHFP